MNVVLDVIRHCSGCSRSARPWGRRQHSVALLLAGLLAGCASLRYGGAPEPSFNADEDLEQLAKIFQPADSISQFYANPTLTGRNMFITGRLTMMNIRYIQFVRQLTTDQQLLDTAGAMLTLGLNLAGTAVGAANTKTILHAIAAGVTGTKEVIDKNYYFDKTIPALVGQMNAERKKALVPILVGLRADLDDYPFAQAVTDLHNYYFAGTFAGAIQGIQVDAAEKEQRQDDIIAKLTPLTVEQVADKAALTRAIGALEPADLPKIQNAIKSLDSKVTPAADLEGAKNQLQGYVRGARTPARISEVADAFKSADITVQQ